MSANSSTTPPATDGGDTSVDDQLPSAALVWITVVVALAAAVVGALIFVATNPKLYLDPEGFAVFAPILFAAQAIERLLEPLASRYGTAAAEKEEVKSAREAKLVTEKATNMALAAQAPLSLTADAVNPVADGAKGAMKDANEKERDALRGLRNKRNRRALILFMAASVIASLVAGVLGLGIIEAMSTKDLREYLGAIDVGLTGIVIAAGTKPLHDLISRIEKSKQNADASTKPTDQLPGTPGASAPPSPAPPASG